MKLWVFLGVLTWVLQAQAERNNEDMSVIDYGLLRPAIVNGDVVPDTMADLRAMIPRIYSLDRSQNGAAESFCTGLLVAPEVVLTAAHCVDVDEPEKLLLKVYFGSRAVDVKKFVMHPEYQPYSMELQGGREVASGGTADLALLFLSVRMDSIIPAVLPVPGYHLKNGQQVLMAGYGLLGVDTPNTEEELHYVEVPAQEISKGRLRIEGKKTSCQGDSGGPLLKKHGGRWMSVGVVSMGDCEKIATHMRTAYFSDWIQEQIDNFLSSFDI